MHELNHFIRGQRQNTPILLMTHVIYGYPTIDASLSLMTALLDAGVPLLEVQFPFTDPVADGPVITDACHRALENPLSLAQCLGQLAPLAKAYPNSRILLMSYLNPLIQLDLSKLADAGHGTLSGLIIPDLPIEQAPLLKPCQTQGIAPIWILPPNCSTDRTQAILQHGEGMLYCMSRTGVTGTQSQTRTPNLADISALKEQTDLPLAIGFGIQGLQDITPLIGLADIAIIGSALLKRFQSEGLDATTHWVRTLMRQLSDTH